HEPVRIAVHRTTDNGNGDIHAFVHTGGRCRIGSKSKDIIPFGRPFEINNIVGTYSYSTRWGSNNAPYPGSQIDSVPSAIQIDTRIIFPCLMAGRSVFNRTDIYGIGNGNSNGFPFRSTSICQNFYIIRRSDRNFANKKTTALP